MINHKITVRFDRFSIQNPWISGIIRRCICETLVQEGVPVPCEINVLVTDDGGIHGINKASRGIDKPTDVLSFPMFSFTPGKLPTDWNRYMDPDTGACALGDMAISLERAMSQAKEFGHSTRREVGYLTIHSVLHLLGYDHMDEGPMKAQMRDREDYIAMMIPGMQRK